MTLDDSAARTVVARVYDAWTANDAAAFVRDFADDVLGTLPRSYLVGRAAVHETMSAMFAGPLRGCRALHEVRDVRVLGDTAIVTTRGTVILADRTDPEPWTLETYVLVRGESWQVRAYHNCPE